MLTIAVMLSMKGWLPLDNPNQRSLHQTPIPRTGGVGIMLGATCGWGILWPTTVMPMLGLTLALSVLFLLDDLRGLPVALRFGVQIAAAALLIWLRPALPGNVLTAVLAVLALTWMTNLYNFMDGSDGLAGGMAMFGFGFYALAAWQAGAQEFALVTGGIALAAAGFLLFNFHPARIFMGDAGSIPLGFLAAGLGLTGWQEGLWPITFPILVFSPFIIDASVTLLKRLLRGEKVWQAHREHYYQRLILMGVGHRGTALAEYGLMLACGLSACLLLEASIPAQIGIISGWSILYGLTAYFVDKAWERH